MTEQKTPPQTSATPGMNEASPSMALPDLPEPGASGTSDSASTSHSTKSGRGWPIFLICLLLGGAGANLAMVAVAVRDPSFAVEENYYQKALHWDQEMAKRRKSAAMGWSLHLQVKNASATAQTTAPSPLKRVSIELLDRNKKPISQASVSVRAFHSGRAARVIAHTFGTTDGKGHSEAVLKLQRPGFWVFQWEVRRGSEVFYSITQRMIGTSKQKKSK